MAEVRVGTSGWSYPEWRGTFYPEGFGPARMLSFYATRLNTVEAHATYRRLPSVDAVARWRDQVPVTFRFAPKAHLGISHRRDLDGVEDRIGSFLERVGHLGHRLGPMLISLPHGQPDLDRLDRILRAIPPPPKGPATAVEVGPTWYTSEVTRHIEERAATLVVVDDDSDSQRVPTTIGPFAYVRLRRSAYDLATLDEWAARLREVRSEGRDAFVYLKHDDTGAGADHALRLAEMLADR